MLRLVGERLRIGVGDEQAVAEARANVGGYRDTLRQVEYSRDQALRALELLVGRYPAAEVAVAQQLAAMPAPAPVGLPSELLERRPDVIAAERRVAAAFDRVEEAKAAQLPRISLTAGGSNVSSELFVLKDHSNPVWSLGANLIAPLYQGGALRAQVEIRTAEQKQAVAEYARAAQRAFSDVENALVGEVALRDREAILAENIKDNQRALDLAQIQFKVGKIDLRTSSSGNSRCTARGRRCCRCKASGSRSASICTSRSAGASQPPNWLRHADDIDVGRFFRNPRVEQRIGDCEQHRADEKAEQTEREQSADDTGEDQQQRQIRTAPDQYRTQHVVETSHGNRPYQHGDEPSGAVLPP